MKTYTYEELEPGDIVIIEEHKDLGLYIKVDRDTDKGTTEETFITCLGSLVAPGWTNDYTYIKVGNLTKLSSKVSKHLGFDTAISKV